MADFIPNGIPNVQFRVMHSGEIVPLKTHVLEVLKNHPRTQLFIGTDSQNIAHKTIYVTTIVFRYPQRGAHVIYYKDVQSRIWDLWTRLWKETEKSIELADFLRQELGVPIEQIDLDYNENPDYPSNKVLKAAKGFIESLGFKAKAKPDITLACWAANALCH